MNINSLDLNTIPRQNLGFPYFRWEVNVSRAHPNKPHSNTNINKFFKRFDPVLNQLEQWNADSMGIFTHLTFGEGYYDWNAMNDDSWNKWIAGLAHMAGRTAAHYKGRVRWWQIGNENDQRSVASVYIPPDVYGRMFRAVRDAVLANDPGATIVTAGMASGAGNGSLYLQQSGVLNIPNVEVAFHSYGQDTYRNDMFGQWGVIHDFIREVKKLGKRFHVTEWGALDHFDAGTPIHLIIQYASRVLPAMKDAQTAHWFAFGRQHNGWPLSPTPGNINPELLTALLKVPRPDSGGGVVVPIPTGPMVWQMVDSGGNIRSTPDDRLDNVVGSLPAFKAFLCDETSHANNDGRYDWKKVHYAGIIGWYALRKGMRRWTI
jgi:hypothetical protein